MKNAKGKGASSTRKTAAKKAAPAKKAVAKTSISMGKTSQGNGTSETVGGLDAEKLLRQDHRKVEQMFAQYEEMSSTQEKQALARRICTELIVHSTLEEEIFYPACRQAEVESDMLDEAQVEHDSAKLLIAELLDGSPDDEFYDAKVKVLGEQVKHHVREEEQPGQGIFAKASAAGVDMEALGARLQTRKQALMAEGEAQRAPRPVSLRAAPGNTPTEEENDMSSRFDRERDDRGRFMSDDDDDRGGSRGGGGSRSSGRYTDDERSSRFGGSRERDEDGRFMSDDRGGRSGGGGSRSSSRDDDDDGRGHGRGGWFGDSRGHAEAAREGWRNRDDDDRGGRGGNMRGGGGGGGSRSSSRDDDDDGRGHGRGGWFGDSRGHAEAAREGWRNREDNDRGGRSSGGRSR